MHAGSLKSEREARDALGYASSNSSASLSQFWPELFKMAV